MLDRRVGNEILINLGFAATNILGLLLTLSISARIFAPVALDLLLLGRRLITAGANLAQLGVSQTLQRYLSFYPDDSQRKADYLRSAILIASISSLCCFIGTWFFREQIASAIAPELSNRISLCLWLCLSVIANVFCFLATSLLLTERRVIAAGLLQTANIHGLFLLAIHWNGESTTAETIFKTVAIGTGVCSLGIVFYYHNAWRKTRSCEHRSARKETVDSYARFGIPRTLVAFADASLILVGPWLLRGKVGETAAFLIAFTVLRLTQATLSPVSQILGLSTARMLGKNDANHLGKNTRLLFSTLLHIGLLTPCFLAPWTRPLIDAWLSTPDLAATANDYFRILVWATVPLAIFYGLRGLIDNRWTFPLNLIALVLSITVQLTTYYALSFWLASREAVSYAVLLGLVCLGLLTTYWIRNDLRQWKVSELPRLATLAGILWATNLSLASFPRPWTFVLAILISSALVLIAWKTHPPEFLDGLRLRRHLPSPRPKPVADHAA